MEPASSNKCVPLIRNRGIGRLSTPDTSEISHERTGRSEVAVRTREATPLSGQFFFGHGERRGQQGMMEGWALKHGGRMSGES